jgi:hypothetical protein
VKNDLSALHGIQQPPQKRYKATPHPGRRYADFPKQAKEHPGTNNIHNFEAYKKLSTRASFFVLHKRRCQQLCSVPRILSATVDEAIVGLAAHVALHVGDVVELCDVAVFLHVGSFVLGHGGDEVFDNFVGDERMAEVHFCDVWL